MADDRASVGRASLWTSISGLVLPIVLAIGISVVLTISDKGNRDDGRYYLLCGLLFVVLELIALVCGIVGWRTTSGQVGFFLSLLSLGLIVVGMGFWVIVSSQPRQAPAPGHIDEPLPPNNPPQVGR
jgi:hypothetical protein